MGKRILLFVVLILACWRLEAQVNGSVTITSGSGSISGNGSSNITITTCDPITFNVSGSANYGGTYLHSVIISAPGTVSSSDPNFSYFGGGSGVCNPVVAPPGLYYSDPGAPSGYDATCTYTPGFPNYIAGRNVVDKWGIGAPYTVGFNVSGIAGSCGDVLSVDVEMNDDAAYGGGDGGGGTISGSITITIVSQSPTISSPGNIAVSCNDPRIVAPSVFPSVSGCSGSPSWSDDGYSPDCTGYTITRRWNYMSGCGDSAPEVVQTITVAAIPNPTYAAPAVPASMGCAAAASFTAPNINYVGNACVSGGTALAIVTNNFTTCGGTIDIEWEVPDACGNPVLITRSITVTPPSPGTPSPVSPENYACLADFNAASVPVVTWSGTCGNNGTFGPPSEAGVPAGCSGGTVTRTWSDTDVCGNSISQTQSITIAPTLPGTPSPVSPENYACLADFNAASVAVVTWSGTCGNNGTFGPPSEAGVPAGCSGGTVTRTWSDTDVCGNSISQTQSITIAPTLPGTPSPVSPENYACLADFNAASVPVVTWSGTCGNDGTFGPPSEAGVPAGCSGGTVTRTWSDTDVCGNPISQTQSITIAPTLPGTPSPVSPENYACLADFNAASVPVVTWSGTCGNDGTFGPPSEAGVPAGCSGGTVTRTWSDTDVCGNPISQTQSITIAPTLPGTPSPVSPENYACLADFTAASVPVVTWSGTCGNDGTFGPPSEAGVPVGCSGGTVTRTWSDTDVCGNPISQTQSITIAPTLPGTPSPVSPENYACLADFNAASVPVVTWSGTCGNDGTFGPPSEAGVPAGCSGGTVTRTWSDTDVCGNPISQTQSITIAPTLPGTPSPVSPENYACLADFTAAAIPVVTWSGTCGNDGTFGPPSEAGVPVGCSGGTVTRTWSDTDVCGNPISQTQSITIAPTLPGTPSPVSPENYACLADFTAAAIPVVTWSGTCGNDGTFGPPSEAGVPVGCSGGTVTRTWSDTDVCGNPISQTQTITIAPTLPGTPSPVSPENYACLADFTAAAIPVVTWSGTCGNDGTFGPPSEIGVPTDCSGGTVTRSWTAIDVCGNPISQTQSITIAPTLPGTPSPVSTQNYACLTDFIAAAIPVVTWSGTCGNNGIFGPPSEAGVPTDCSGGTVTRSWTAIDVCGNPISQTQSITIAPTLPGTPSPVSTQNYACLTDFTAAAIPVVTWSGTCGNNGTFGPPSEAGVPIDCSGGTVTRSWTAIDVCGNPISQTQTINIAPTLPGTPSPVSTQNYACLTDFIAAAIPVVTWSGTCGNNGTFGPPSEAGVPTDCSGGTVTRSWTAIDVCGNPISQTQTINISSPPSPTITAAPTESYACFSDYSAAPIPVISWSGTCGNNGTFGPPTEIGLPSNCSGGTVTRSWSDIDLCGNPISQSQTIIVAAPSAVTISPVSNPTISCVSELASLPAPIVTWSGSCSNFGTFGAPSETPPPSGCLGGTVIRTWSGTDICGNTLTQSQTITVDPVPQPVWFSALPNNQNVDCGDVISFISGLTNLSYSNSVVGSCLISGSSSPNTDYSPALSCGDTFKVWWDLPAACSGSGSTHEITITIKDNIAPTFNVPGTVNIDCDLDYTDDSNTGGGAFNVNDNCDLSPIVDVSYQDISSGCDKRYRKTFKVTDECGNFSTKTQIINVNSGSTADWINAPADITISCLADLPPLQDLDYAGASAICASPGSATGLENTSGLIGRCGFIIRTWTPNPGLCGVPAPFIQQITIEPTVAPAVVGTLPQDKILTCNEANNGGGPISLVLSCAVSTINVAPSSSTSGNKITYAWNYSGACAVDKFTHTQVITVPETIVYTIEPPTSICEGAILTSADFNFIDGTSTQDLSVAYFLDAALTSPLTSTTATGSSLSIYAQVSNSIGCTDPAGPFLINVIPQVSAGIDNAVDFCGNESINLIDYISPVANQGGTFTDIDGTFAPLAGFTNISLSSLQPGTYNVRYDVAGQLTCPSDDALLTFKILGKPQISSSNKVCSADLLTYDFEFTVTGSFANVSTNLGTLTNLGGGKYKVTGVSKDNDAIITATGNVANCDANLTVARANCACGIIADPTIVINNPFNCFGTSNPTLEVGNIDAGNKALWYSDVTLTTKINEGLTYLPLSTAVGKYDYYVVQEAPGNCFSNAVKVSFEIKPLPVVNKVALDICDDNFDGLTSFNLASKKLDINAVVANNITYFLSLADAQANANAITSPSSFTNTIANNQTIYTRTININNCINYSEFALVVNKKADINVSPVDVTCAGAGNGNATINVTNGLTNLEFKLLNTAYAMNASFANLKPGIDTAFAKTSKGCITKVQFIIKDGITLSLDGIVDYTCNDGGTKTDPNDDKATIQFKITGGTGKFIVKENGNQIGGDFDYNALVSLPARAADGASGKLTIEDKTLGCPIEISFGPLSPCSSDCTLDMNLVQGPCDDGGTKTDPSDDKILFTLTPIAANGGAVAKLTIDGVDQGNVVYNSPKVISLPADGKVHVFKLVDILKGACTDTKTTAALVSCSNECVITDITTVAKCSDNNTDTDPSDDTFTFTYNVAASNSTSLTYTLEGESGTFEYGKEYTSNVYPISGGDKTFKVIDGNAKCEKSFTVKAPKTCSSTCKIFFDQFTVNCNNKGTSKDPSDDSYDIKVLVKHTNGSPNGYKIFVDQVLKSTGVYGVEKVINIVADSKQHEVSIEDADETSCRDSKTTASLIPCSDDCDISAVINVGECNNGGTFDNITSDDTYDVTITPSGLNTKTQNWKFTLDNVDYTGIFGESVTIKGLKVNDGNKQITIQAVGGNNCPKDFTILAPPSCSSPCDIKIAELVAGDCNNNNTGKILTDDYFSASFKVVGTEPGLTRFIAKVNNKEYGPYEYGKTVTIDSIPADGMDHTISVRDTSTDKSFCVDSKKVNKAPCSSCSGSVVAIADQVITCASPSVTLSAQAANALDYLWNGPGVSNKKGQTISTGNAGTYEVTALFAFGCDAKDDVMVTKDANIPSVDAGQDKVLNCEITSDKLIATTSSSLANLNIEWKDATGNKVGTGLTLDVTNRGIYTISLEDKITGCKTSDEVEVIKYDNVPLAQIVADPTNIIDCQLKTIVLNAMDQDNSTYTWERGDQNKSGNTINVTEPGMVKLIVIDTLSKCSNSTELMIEDGVEYPLISIKSPDPLTCKVYEISLDASTSMSGNNILHTWLDAQGNTIGNGLTLKVTRAGTYTLVSKDKVNGCENKKEVSVQDIGERFNYELTTKEIEVKCNDRKTTLSLTVQGSPSDYTITWTSNNPSNKINASNPLKPLVEGVGNYSVFIVNKATQCEAKEEAKVFTPVSTPKFTEIEILNETCKDDNDGAVTINGLEGGTLPYIIKINGETVGTTTQTNLKPGIYKLEVIDGKGCAVDSLIKIIAGNDLQIDLPISINVDVGEEIILIAKVNVPDTLLKDYYWSPAEMVDCVNCFRTRATTFSDNDFLFTVIDINGCMRESKTEVRVRLVPTVTVPNIIKTSGGENGEFFVSAEYVKNIKELMIFDRWGNKVFQRENIAPNERGSGWFGTMNDASVSEGVYAYRIVAELSNPYVDKDGNTITEKIVMGDVTVLR